MNYQTEWIEIKGTKVHVQRKGTGDPLLFLHGAGGAGNWSPFYDMLSAHYEVIVPEHPGFGASDDPEWLEDMSDLVLFYKDFLDHYQLQKVHLAGHSLGGWLALEFTTFFNDRVSSLTLINAAGIHVDGVQIGDNFAWHPDEQARKLIFNSEMAEERVNRQLTEEEIKIDVKNRTTTAKLVWTPRWYNPKLQKRLNRITVPTLIVWGEQDQLFPVQYAYAFHRFIPSSSLTVISECGHSPQLEKPGQLMKAIEGFAVGSK